MPTKIHNTLIQNLYRKAHAGGINTDRVKEYIFFLKHPHWLWGPYSPPFTGYQGLSLQE
jgi:hypothetical protein